MKLLDPYIDLVYHMYSFKNLRLENLPDSLIQIQLTAQADKSQVLSWSIY